MSKKYDYEFFIDGAVFINTEKDSEFDMETACDILNNQADKIADLEAKLAESENKIYELMTKLNMKEYAPVFCRLAGRECEELGTIDQLKQQLAEERKKVVQEVKQKLCRVEDTLINLGNGKEDALRYFVEILNQIERN